MKITATEFVVHPEGKFILTFRSVEEVNGEFQGKPTKQLLWKLESEEKDDNGNGITVFHYTGLTFSEKSKLGQMYCQVTATPWNNELEFDTDDFINVKVYAFILHNEKGRAIIQKFSPYVKGKVKVKAQEDPFEEE